MNVHTSLDKRSAGPSGGACRRAQLFEVSEINWAFNFCLVNR